MAYTTRQVANIFGVTMQTIRRWVEAGRLPAEQDGPYDPLSFDEDQIDEAIEAYQGSDIQRYQLQLQWSPPDLEELL